MGGNIFGLTLVLFALEHFRSPVLAGLVAFASLAPGLILSPIAGVFLDRHGPVRMIALDLGTGSLMVTTLLALNLSGHLSPPFLLVIAALGGLTMPLTVGGSRTLVPLLLPPHLWDRGNGIDSAGMSLVNIAGPAVAGIVLTAVGPDFTFALTGGFWVIAGILILSIKAPVTTRNPPESVLVSAWSGLRYLFRTPNLRAIAFTMPIANLGTGLRFVALPVIVLKWPGSSPALVGVLWAADGVGSALGAVLVTSIGTVGREKLIAAVSLGGMTVSAILFLASRGPLLAMLAMCMAGFFDGPFQVAFFSLRQRATEPQWLSRTMTVSASINWLGQPVGSGLAGPLVAASAPLGILAAAACWLVATVVCTITITSSQRPER
jgi:MFS family permease